MITITIILLFVIGIISIMVLYKPESIADTQTTEDPNAIQPTGVSVTSEYETGDE